MCKYIKKNPMQMIRSMEVTRIENPHRRLDSFRRVWGQCYRVVDLE
jgi:hypothetical protein